MALSNDGAEQDRLMDALYALDESLARLGMHTNKTERLLTDDTIQLAATDEEAWDALITDIATELDKQVARQRRVA
jgi:beta-xylosidase